MLPFSLPAGKWQASNLGQQWVAHHARGAEAAGDAAHAHTLQVIVLAGFGTLQPFSPRVVSRTHKLDHGRPAGQAPFALEIEKSKRPSVMGDVALSSTLSFGALGVVTQLQRHRAAHFLG